MSDIPRKPSAKPGKPAQDFTALVAAVRRVHDECAAAVNRTVNTTLTLRNWLIGSYIRDYEQNGADRAQYGSTFLKSFRILCKDVWTDAILDAILGYAANFSIPIPQFGNQ